VIPAPGAANQGAADEESAVAEATVPEPTASPTPPRVPTRPDSIPAEEMLTLPDAAETPELQTVASDLPAVGWVAAFGGMFLAVVLAGFALVRRHARRHG
jgi:hypothetical protein